MASIVLSNVDKIYAGGVKAVNGLNLEIKDGEFMVLVGPSGCGKSTALRMIAGLEDISGGEISIGDKVVNHLPPKDRDIAMVFQNYALYPHMTVEENLAFGLKLRKMPKAEIQQRVGDAAKMLGLDPYLKRKPAALSGGQRQRVAMGRAIVREPQAFLMDEPLSNLDAKLRVSMRASLNTLHERLGVTTVYVTHDQVEAMTLGDRVCVLRDGDTTYVAFADLKLPIPASTFSDKPGLDQYIGKKLILGIRPSDFEDATSAGSHANGWTTLSVKAEVTEELGSEINVLFLIDAPPVEHKDTVAAADTGDEDESALPLVGDKSLWTARVNARSHARSGQPIDLVLDTHNLHFFDTDSGLSIGHPANIGR